MSGQAGGLFEGNVVVQARDTDGSVLAEGTTTIDSPDAGTGGDGPWSLELTIVTQPGTTGDIRSFSISPADRSETASDSVSVTYGEVETIEPTIQINCTGDSR